MYTDLEQASRNYTPGLGQRGRKPYQGEGLRGLQPPFWGKFSTCLATHVCPFFKLKIMLWILNVLCAIDRWLTDRHLRENKPSGLEGPEMILHTFTFASTWCSRLKMLSQRSIVYLRIEKLDLTPTHVCVLICHAWWKSLSHYSINWHILKNIFIIHFKETRTKEGKEKSLWMIDFLRILFFQ